jgi:eukaryotic-like serine/threonine-protein kinase
VTQSNEGPASPAVNRNVLTVATSQAGEVLATRYRLEEHINDDAHGRQVWRGIDVVLRRPIAIVVRHPGGPTAVEMISAAVAASRITHPHLVDVYDAVDEGSRAYVVREWVDGTSLRDLVADGPLDSVRATSIAHAVASAISAAHATGMVHGNVHPGSVLVADDGRVMLADARADERATPERDIRAIGAVLYCALTGHWPYAEAGPDRLPDAIRDAAGHLASPRQVRGGLPSYLSELATSLLDPRVELPPADQVALDLSRLDTDANEEFFSDGPLGFRAMDAPRGDSHRGRSGRKLLVGVVALLVISAGGLLLATKVGGNNPAQGQGASNPSTGSGSTSPASPGPSTTPQTQAGPVPLTSNSIRIIETGGNDARLTTNVGRAVDGDENTYWLSNWYNSATYGGFKSGMGLLINLGKPMSVTSVRVDFEIPGATVQAYVGSSDPGLGNANSKKILATYKPIGDDGPQMAGSTADYPIGQKAQYILIWVTKIPPAGSIAPGKFLLGINEVAVTAQ